MISIQDFLAALGGVLNGVTQSVMAMTFGFAMLPSALAYLVGIVGCLVFNSAVPISFQAETMAMAGAMGKTRRERLSMVILAGLGMTVLGAFGLLESIVAFAGEHVTSAMMAGVGLILTKLSIDMVRKDYKLGGISMGVGVITYLVTKSLVYTSLFSVLAASVAYRFVPDKAVVDVFKVKYDYHNVKTLLKAQALELDGKRLLLDAGRVSAEELTRALTEGEYDQLPPALGQAAREAREVLSATGDPQLSDFVLDRAYYAEMLTAAQATHSDFLVRYVRATIDAANLRGAVRTLRMKKGGDFLKKVLFEGGTVATEAILTAALGGSLEEPFRSTTLRQAAELGAEAVRGGDLTRFEKACDDAVTEVAAGAKSVPFGVEAVIGYLVAKEIEFTAVRIIMSSRMAGITGETIRERLREAYV